MHGKKKEFKRHTDLKSFNNTDKRMMFTNVRYHHIKHDIHNITGKKDHERYIFELMCDAFDEIDVFCDNDRVYGSKYCSGMSYGKGSTFHSRRGNCGDAGVYCCGYRAR